MKYISKVLLLGVSLVTMGVVLPSCEQKKAFDLEQYESISLQISSFSMSTKQEGVDLSGYFFAIAHHNEGGEITNRRPLPYNLDLKEVSLSIQASSAATKLYVALDGGEYQEFKSGETKLDIPHTAQTMKIKVDLPSDASASATSLSSYVYTVHLKRYQYDPRTITWEKNPLTAGVRLSGTTSSGIVAYGKGHLFYDGTQGYQVSYTEAGKPTIAPLSLGGLPAGERVVTLEEGGGVVYALTDKGHLYKLSGTSWQSLGVDTEVTNLLAVLPSGREGIEPTLSLVVKGSTPTWASYTAGKLSVFQEPLPENFPAKGDYHKAFVSSRAMVGSHATLLATSYRAGKLYRTSWYFTPQSEAWMPIATEQVDGTALSGASYLMSEGLYYRLEATAKGLVVLTSEEGKSWTNGSEQALGTLDLSAISGRNILAWPTPANTISLLSGVDNTGVSSATLWIGTPLRNVAQ